MYHEHLYANKWDNLVKMSILLERHWLQKLTQGEIEYLNRFIKSKETSLVIYKNQKTKSAPSPPKLRRDGFPCEFYHTFKEEIVQSFANFFKKWKRTIPNSSYEANIIVIPKLKKDITRKEAAEQYYLWI